MVARVEAAKRNFLKAAAIVGTTFAGGLIVPPALAAKAKKMESEVTPPEDLMREHGVLDRLLLVYEAGVRKFASNEDFDPGIIASAAEIVRDFIENYHERSEEEAVFPRFKQAGKMVSLVDTLLAQHQAGRRVTLKILQAAPGSHKDGDDRQLLVASIQSFISMYRPHAAREDTDLFPMLRGLVSAHEYDAMAEDFEKKEHQLFGSDGFEMMAKKVAGLEQHIEIGDLAQFTRVEQHMPRPRPAVPGCLNLTRTYGPAAFRKFHALSVSSLGS